MLGAYVFIKIVANLENNELPLCEKIGWRLHDYLNALGCSTSNLRTGKRVHGHFKSR